MLIWVKCIKLDENKASNKSFTRGYSEILSYSNHFYILVIILLKTFNSKNNLPFEQLAFFYYSNNSPR